MPDREKVVRALDCLSRNAQDGPCNGCAYFRPFTDDPDTGWCDRTSAMTDALKLLKEQEPGVMALEEVKKHNNKDNCVWFELRDIVVIPVFVRQDRQETIIENQCILSDQTIPHLYWKNIDYCKKWRCWNAKPTDEQRKAAKWGD